MQMGVEVGGGAGNWRGKVVEGNQEQDPGLRMLIFGKPVSVE